MIYSVLKDCGRPVEDKSSRPDDWHRVTSSARGSLVKTYPSQARVPGSTALARGFSGMSCESFARFDLASWSWKTSQLSLLGGSTLYSERWPRAGMMRSGIAYRQQPSAPRTAVIGSSWSRGEYPTPTASTWTANTSPGPAGRRPSLHTWARTWPTPLASEHKRITPTAGQLARRSPALAATVARAGLWPTATSGDAKRSGSRGSRGTEGNRANEGTSLTDATCRSGRPHPETCTHGGQCRWRLNPRFVEWLMGFPPAWTLLGCER